MRNRESTQIWEDLHYSNGHYHKNFGEKAGTAVLSWASSWAKRNICKQSKEANRLKECRPTSQLIIFCKITGNSQESSLAIKKRLWLFYRLWDSELVPFTGKKNQWKRCRFVIMIRLSFWRTIQYEQNLENQPKVARKDQIN